MARLDHTWPAEDSATWGERLGPAVSFATTEHFNLQTARVATVSEANGRASLYRAYAQRIARLRAFYLGIAPELEPFVLVGGGQRAEGLLHHERLRPSAWQLTLTTAGMVAVVNSVVIGACVGLAVTLLPIGSLVVALTSGAVAGLAALSMQRRHHRRASDRYTPEGIDRAAIFAP